MRASMLLHGSTLDAFLHCGADSLFPVPVDEGGSLEAMARGIASSCATIQLNLELVRTRVWN